MPRCLRQSSVYFNEKDVSVNYVLYNDCKVLMIGTGESAIYRITLPANMQMRTILCMCVTFCHVAHTSFSPASPCFAFLSSFHREASLHV